MRLLFFGLLISFTSTLTAQETQFNPDKKYHTDSLKRWTKSMMNGTSEKHPGFYWYTTKEKFDYLIDSTTKTIDDSLTALDFYRKIKPLFSQIGCLHTSISLSREHQNYLDKTSSLIPLEIFIDSNGSVLISKNYSLNQNIPIGSEIISINDKPINDIVNRLLKSIPSDGYNQTEKILVLNHRFAFWYQTMIEVTQAFSVETKTNGTVKTFDLRGVSKEVFPTLKSLESNYQNALEFDIKDSIGTLKVHSFAKSDIKKSGQSFKKFVKTTFKTLKEQNINNLILDLRYNTGGSDGNAAFLASYFFDKSFSYWDKIEVTEAIAKEIKGINRLFYKKPYKIDNSYRWRKTWMTKEFDYYEKQKPARNHFMGKTYVITNGLCMSSCADFTAVLSHNDKAIVIGQETGGGFQGNTSGMMPTAKLPTGLQATIPLLKYTNAVDPNKNFGRGTIPDYIVIPTFDNWINKKDVEMELAVRLINGD